MPNLRTPDLGTRILGSFAQLPSRDRKMIWYQNKSVVVLNPWGNRISSPRIQGDHGLGVTFFSIDQEF